MLKLYPTYLLWNRCKTLTESLDPTRANGTDKPCCKTADLGYSTVPGINIMLSRQGDQSSSSRAVEQHVSFRATSK